MGCGIVFIQFSFFMFVFFLVWEHLSNEPVRCRIFLLKHFVSNFILGLSDVFLELSDVFLEMSDLFLELSDLFLELSDLFL